jgi:hypothetical protein
VAALLCVVAAGCGNSSDDAGGPGATAGDDGSEAGSSGGDRDTFVEIEGVPGVAGSCEWVRCSTTSSRRTRCGRST